MAERVRCVSLQADTGTSKQSSQYADDVRYSSLMWPVEGMYTPGLSDRLRLRIVRWLADHDINPDDVSHVKVGRRSARVFTFARNAQGQRYVGGDGHVALQPPTTIKRRSFEQESHGN